MSSREFQERLARRARRVGLPIRPELGAQLEVYYRLLSTWNKKINLTGLNLSEYAPESLDRLLIEPLVAASHVKPAVRSLLTIDDTSEISWLTVLLYQFGWFWGIYVLSLISVKIILYSPFRWVFGKQQVKEMVSPVQSFKLIVSGFKNLKFSTKLHTVFLRISMGFR